MPCAIQLSPGCLKSAFDAPHAVAAQASLRLGSRLVVPALRLLWTVPQLSG